MGRRSSLLVSSRNAAASTRGGVRFRVGLRWGAGGGLPGCPRAAKKAGIHCLQMCSSSDLRWYTVYPLHGPLGPVYLGGVFAHPTPAVGHPTLPALTQHPPRREGSHPADDTTPTGPRSRTSHSHTHTPPQRPPRYVDRVRPPLPRAPEPPAITHSVRGTRTSLAGPNWETSNRKGRSWGL